MIGLVKEEKQAKDIREYLLVRAHGIPEQNLADHSDHRREGAHRCPREIESGNSNGYG